MTNGTRENWASGRDEIEGAIGPRGSQQLARHGRSPLKLQRGAVLRCGPDSVCARSSGIERYPIRKLKIEVRVLVRNCSTSTAKNPAGARLVTARDIVPEGPWPEMDPGCWRRQRRLPGRAPPNGIRPRPGCRAPSPVVHRQADLAWDSRSAWAPRDSGKLRSR